MLQKAISIKQPWANLILEGKKTLEIRTWQTSYRGELILCSSKSPDIYPAGYALGIIEILDIAPMKLEDEVAAHFPFCENTFAWKIRIKKKFDSPILIKGKLAIFEIDL